MNSVKYFGINIVSAGMVTPPDDNYEVVSQRHDGVYKKIVVRDGIIMGMVFAGDIERSGIVYNLMKDRVDVSRFKEVLVAPDFGLSSLPDDIWHARLGPSILKPAGVEPVPAME
jgi:NAD(P)H-nitrite reductase large subunit